jgi:two-component system cell cycle sensor histidine kinase/response regulator CckA
MSSPPRVDNSTRYRDSRAARSELGKPLRALIVEDCEPDAELLLHELRQGGYDVTAERVQTAEAMRAALQREPWHIVLSDYSMPVFSAPAALAVLHEVSPETPFIIVSGTIGEETAVTSLKAGACDFLIKGRLARLVPAIERELREVELKRERARKQAALEEELRQSQKMEGIGRLAGGIAHDFNNMLTAIIGYSDMVLEQVGPNQSISNDVREIRKAADRAASLTRQLLAFSRKQTLRIAAVDLNDVITNTRDMLQRLIGEDVEVLLRLTSSSTRILADRTQLEQVLMNLATNARDAMPRGGKLTIETTAADISEVAAVAPLPATPGSYVRLRISDTGHGMSAATREHIFEPFFTTKPVGHGTGLGLATVYGVVQQLGGQITVTSEPDQGTTFSLYFMQATADVTQPAPARPHTSHASPSRNGDVVLIVEDEGGVRQLAARVLKRHGYVVLEADSTVQALALIEQADHRLSLIISDVVMPTMDGPQLIARVREKQPGMKVLYMSGYAGETLARRGGLEANARLLEKPFSASSLLESVKDILEQS